MWEIAGGGECIFRGCPPHGKHCRQFDFTMRITSKGNAHTPSSGDLLLCQTLSGGSLIDSSSFIHTSRPPEPTSQLSRAQNQPTPPASKPTFRHHLGPPRGALFALLLVAVSSQSVRAAADPRNESTGSCLLPLYRTIVKYHTKRLPKTSEAKQADLGGGGRKETPKLHTP